MFGALISGHKFSDPEFCKNKIVSSCTLTFEITCLAAFVHIWALETKAGNWGICSCRLHGAGHYLFPINPFSLDFPDLPLIINNNYEKVSVYTGKKWYHHKHSSFHSQWNWSYSWCSVVMLSSNKQGSIFFQRSEHNSYTCKLDL